MTSEHFLAEWQSLSPGVDFCSNITEFPGFTLNDPELFVVERDVLLMDHFEPLGRDLGERGEVPHVYTAQTPTYDYTLLIYEIPATGSKEVREVLLRVSRQATVPEGHTWTTSETRKE